MKIQILLIVLIFPLLLVAQENEWGVGVIVFPSEETEIVDVFNAPEGIKNGTLELELSQYNLNPSWREIEWSGVQMAIPDEALISIGYEVSGLIVHEEQNGFLKIMYRNGEISSWVKIEELERKDYTYFPWIEFMCNTNRTFFTMDYGMNVRKNPTIHAAKILMVKGDQFEITPTGKRKGLWAEVTIHEYNSVYCEEPHKLINTYKGWMKILDDKGFPNLWFYPKGC